jgi:O-antigen ligase
MIKIQTAIYRNAHFMWAFLVCFTLLASIGFMDGKSEIGWLAIISIALLHLLYSNGQALAKFKYAFAAVMLIFFYALIVSQFKARSTLICIQLFSVFYLFCALYDLNVAGKSRNCTPKSLSYQNLICWTTLIAGSVQAVVLIIAYINSPIRATGLFLDYSQASFFILLCFGIAYPLTRGGKWSHLFALIMFLGYFTTFSRTSNFLLVVLLALICVFEFRHQNKKYFLALLCVIGLACIAVYAYPLTVEAELVNRRGFSDLATMNSRTYYWQFAIDAIKENPLWGYGPGNYEYLGAKEQRPYELITWAHNDYLQVWVALGVFWFIAFVGSIGYLIISFFPKDIFGSKPVDLHKYMAWSLICCAALYMLINFIVFAMPFQILIAFSLIELFTNEPS